MVVCVSVAMMEAVLVTKGQKVIYESCSYEL